MAAPKVAAVAGQIISKYGKDVLTPMEVKHIIEKSAVDIYKPSYDGLTGYGFVDAVNALK